MKHIFLTLIGAAAILGATSCSQELEGPEMNGNGGETTVSVQIPVSEGVSRAVPAIPEGYKLRCIMQLIDATGAAIADGRYVEEVAAGSENVSFSFIAPEGYKGAMFWADYVKNLDTDYIYTTTDLHAVGYNAANAADAFNNAAADAFYGYMLAGNKSIALTRPFTRITLKSADANYNAYTTVKVTDMAAPTEFNVENGNTAAYATGLASDEFTVGEDGSWFSTYLFVGNNSGATLGEGHDIALTLGGATTTDVTISGADIPLTRNYDITALISATAGDVTDVTVTFPGDMVDPNAPRDIALGDYVNADGTYGTTYDADKAVAIVYALADAGTKQDGKEVAAYAYALSNTSRVTIGDDASIIGTATLNAELYSGPAGPAAWNAFVALAGNDNNLVNAMNTWADNHPLTGSKLSAWYAPTASQLVDLVGTTFNGGEWMFKPMSNLEITFPARNTAVFDALNGTGSIQFTHNGTAANYFACEIGTDGRVASVQVDDANHTFSGVLTKESNPYLIRPVITIYK